MQTPFNESVTPPISLKELAAILIKHYDFHEGFYEVGVQFNFAVGSVGPERDQAAPGAILTVGGVGLSKCPETSPLGVDAAVVNPAAKPTPKKAARKKSVK